MYVQLAGALVNHKSETLGLSWPSVLDSAWTTPGLSHSFVKRMLSPTALPGTGSVLAS